MTFVPERTHYRTITFILLFSLTVLLIILVSPLWNIYLPTIPLSAGDSTVFNRTESAYQQASPNLTKANLAKHQEGDIIFEKIFVTPPANINPGLGPLFNNVSCTACHIRNGRGLSEKGQLLIRVSDSKPKAKVVGLSQSQEQSIWNEVFATESFPFHLESNAQASNLNSVPGLGTQIQDQAINGYQPEATVEINWQETTGKYGDGTKYQLRSPDLQIIMSNGVPLPSQVQTSLRLPSPIYGLGLLEAVSEKTIEELADPDDQDGDGISGRLNQVWDVQTQSLAAGRFGWKANNPNILQQTASAYANDIGVTNPLFPEPDGTSDLDQEELEKATFYIQTLAVPARTLTHDKQIKRGERLFDDIGCAACHIRTLTTGKYHIRELSNQMIHPYTDLLLHDMGEGLADERPDFLATGTEWRTPPLWGIGLTHEVIPYSSFLHDGRARTLEEAILWHGGEAEVPRELFRNLPKRDRIALIEFLDSL